jgi:hypothetical protein
VRERKVQRFHPHLDPLPSRERKQKLKIAEEVMI